MATNIIRGVCPRCEEQSIIWSSCSEITEDYFMVDSTSSDRNTLQLCTSCGIFSGRFGEVIAMRKNKSLTTTIKEEVVDGVSKITTETSSVWSHPCRCDIVITSNWTSKIVPPNKRVRVCGSCDTIDVYDRILINNKKGLVGPVCKRCDNANIVVACDNDRNPVRYYCETCKILRTAEGLFLGWHPSLTNTTNICCNSWRENSPFDKWLVLGEHFDRLVCSRCCNTHPIHFREYIARCRKKNACERCGDTLTDKSGVKYCPKCELSYTNDWQLALDDLKCKKCNRDSFLVVPITYNRDIAQTIYPGVICYRLCSSCDTIHEKDVDIMKKFNLKEDRYSCVRCKTDKSCVFRCNLDRFATSFASILVRNSTELKCIKCNVIKKDDSYYWEQQDCVSCICGQNDWKVSDAEYNNTFYFRITFRWCKMCSAPYSGDLPILESNCMPKCCYTSGTCQHCREEYRPGGGTRCSNNQHHVCRVCSQSPCRQATNRPSSVRILQPPQPTQLLRLPPSRLLVPTLETISQTHQQFRVATPPEHIRDYVSPQTDTFRYRNSQPNNATGRRIFLEDEPVAGETLIDRANYMIREHLEDLNNTPLPPSNNSSLIRDSTADESPNVFVPRPNPSANNIQERNGYNSLLIAQYEHERTQAEERANQAEQLARSAIVAAKQAEEAKRKELEEKLKIAQETIQNSQQSTPSLPTPTPTEQPKEQPCCICLTNKRDTVIIPCGHIVLCYECSRNMVRKPCPMCQQMSISVYKTYSP